MSKSTQKMTQYEVEKKKLAEARLSAAEYEKAVKALCKKLKI